MDPTDVITLLGQKEGRKLRFRPDDHDPIVPYINLSISPSTNAKSTVKGHNHIGHDNESRMPFVENLITNMIAPHMDRETPRLNGDFLFELHDSYSYLPRGDEIALYKGAMTWSKRTQHDHVVLLPDIYQFANYQGLVSKDPFTSWQSKPLNKIGFYGTTTGNRSPLLNQRINTCIWSLQHRDIIDAYITSIAQMSTSDVVETIGIGTAKQIIHDKVDHASLFKYKFLLDIPGNTASWDRVPLVLQSQSLLFKMPCSDMVWYYPLLHNRTHYVAANHHNMQSQLTYYLNNPKEAQFIIDSANKFYKTFLHGNHAIMYTVALMEEAAHNLAP
jgi:hypothetical protein